MDVLLLQDLESSGFLGTFSVGQLVSCIVLEVEDHHESKRVLLSLRLSLLHKGLTLDLVQVGMVCHHKPLM